MKIRYMLYNEYFSSEITCSFVGCYGDYSLSGYGLMIFTLSSFLITSILLLFYNIIPKSKNLKSEIDNPIYQSKDIILQSNSLNASFIIAEKTTSVWIKVITFIMIFVISFTPLYELLGIGYF